MSDDLDKIIARMSPAQKRAIREGYVFGGIDIVFTGVRFASLDAMRRLGILERDTILAVGRAYADQRGVHLQWKERKPKEIHTWYLTDLGQHVRTRLRGYRIERSFSR